MISFSAHSDFTQISTFIDAIQTPNVVLVHGEKAEMGRLKNKLQEIKPQLAVFSPAILQTVSLTFPKSSVTHVLGSLAKKFKLEIDDSTESGSPIEHDAVLAVTPVGKSWLMDPSEISDFVDVDVNVLKQILHVPLDRENFDTFEASLRRIFSNVQRHQIIPFCLLVEHGRVTATIDITGKNLTVSWEACPMNNAVADTCVFVAVQIVAAPSPWHLMVKSESGVHLIRKTKEIKFLICH
eukprot:GHVP01042073.1.p1 GENE.GHVP01042073.1~~GHVP01042073.1.p1  ORF type:complete len:239 (+),score=33.95 GHVP01042073.1:207-923(+)